MPESVSAAARLPEVHEAIPAVVANQLDDAVIQVWHFPRDRSERRQPLLEILAGYLGKSWQDVVLTDNAHGKPRLAGVDAGRFDFNWSHSHGHAVLAVACGLPRLGIDLEQVRHDRRMLAIAERHFTVAEYRWLAGLADDALPGAFTRLWTAKEAVLKADGHGIAFGLDRFGVDVTANQPCLMRPDDELGTPESWQLRQWQTAPDRFVTLAWQGGKRDVSRFRWRRS